jgi:PPOX class probable F420-dependent enzyme
MAKLSDDARKAIDAPRLAHLVTLNPDGSPQVTIVWAGMDGDDVVIAHMNRHRKIENVLRDDRVALSVEAEGNTNGLDNYLVVYGRARITDGGAPEWLQHLAETYIGPGVKFPPMDDPAPGWLMTIAVDRVAGVGPWQA